MSEDTNVGIGMVEDSPDEKRISQLEKELASALKAAEYGMGLETKLHNAEQRLAAKTDELAELRETDTMLIGALQGRIKELEAEVEGMKNCDNCSRRSPLSEDPYDWCRFCLRATKHKISDEDNMKDNWHIERTLCV